MFAYTSAEPGGNAAVAVIRGGVPVPLPTQLFGDRSVTYPVGWLDHTGDRLLVARFQGQNPTPAYFVVDVSVDTVLGRPLPTPEVPRIALDDPRVLGTLSGAMVIRYDSVLRTVSVARVACVASAPALVVVGAWSSGLLVTSGTTGRLQVLAWSGTLADAPARLSDAVRRAIPTEAGSRLASGRRLTTRPLSPTSAAVLLDGMQLAVAQTRYGPPLVPTPAPTSG